MFRFSCWKLGGVGKAALRRIALILQQSHVPYRSSPSAALTRQARVSTAHTQINLIPKKYHHSGAAGLRACTVPNRAGNGGGAGIVKRRRGLHSLRLRIWRLRNDAACSRLVAGLPGAAGASVVRLQNSCWGP